MTSVFRTWVAEQGGPDRLSVKLGVHRDTIYKWLRREAVPNLRAMAEIHALSNGKINHGVVLAHVLPPTRRGRAHE